MSKAKKKVKMRTWHGYCIVNEKGQYVTEVVGNREYLEGCRKMYQRIARVEVREIVTKRSNG